MNEIENTDDLKRALGVDSLREMSGEKVIELAQMIQNGEISEGVQRALLSLVPEAFTETAKIMDDSLSQAVASNDKSSSDYHKAVAQSKAIYEKILQDPDASDENKKKALEELSRLDEQVFEHDVNNKKFNLETLRLKKETLVKVVSGVIFVAAVVTPAGRKLFIESGKTLEVPGK